MDIELTRPDGKKIKIDGKLVVRVRMANTSELAKTLVNWAQSSLVKEKPSEVAELVKKDQPKLAELRLPNGQPVWFNAAEAKGPVPFTHNQAPDGTRSQFLIAGGRQPVANTHEEVAAAINAGGGKALPIPFDNLLDLPVTLFWTVRSLLVASPAQDAE